MFWFYSPKSYGLGSLVLRDLIKVAQILLWSKEVNLSEGDSIVTYR